jgi:hypothetical protein
MRPLDSFPFWRVGLLPLTAALLCGCDVRWPDHAGVMGAPASETLAVTCPPALAQGLTQSSR